MLRRIVPGPAKVAAAAAAAVLIVAGATGCSATHSASAEAEACSAPLSSGAFASGVEVTGAFGELPTAVKMPEDLPVSVSQREFVSQAADRDEIVAGENELVGVNMAFFDSGSGDKLYESAVFSGDGTAPEYLLLTEEMANPLSDAVVCAAPGDRVVLAMSPEAGGQLAMQLGGDPEAPLVGVIDVVSVSGLAAQGKTQGLPNGYPAVAVDANGVPGIVDAPRSIPQGTQSAVRIEGSGDVVAADDNVIVQVLAVDPEKPVPAGAPMNTRVLSSTWSEGGPALLGSEEVEAAQGSAAREMLTGATVGSQIVVLSNEDEGSQILVIDVLGIG